MQSLRLSGLFAAALFAFTGPIASATAAGAACGVARSLSTASLSFASLAAGSACAFSTRSSRSPSLMYCTLDDLADVSIDALRAAISA